MNVLSQHCPHCGKTATVRTSERLSDTMRALYFQCRDMTCGHTWKSHLEAVCTITPPAIPNPRVNLPLSPRSELLQRRIAAHSDPRQLSLDHHE